MGNDRDGAERAGAGAVLHAEQRARRDYFAMMHGGKPSPGPLRQRLAATLMKLAIALDGQAQGALAGQPVVSHR